MTRYLTVAEVLELHQSAIERWGGSGGIRDLNVLESALAQPRQSFGGNDLYPDLPSKATALCFSLEREKRCLEPFLSSIYFIQMHVVRFTNVTGSA